MLIASVSLSFSLPNRNQHGQMTIKWNVPSRKNGAIDWAWWHTPEIPATWEEETEGLQFQASLGQSY
jgi:hypothetical protein